MSEKRTLSRWLRSDEVYRAEDDAPAARQWRNALLAEYEYGPLVERPLPADDARAPLQWHHLVLLAPAGVALFALGWLFGSEAMLAIQVSRVSPLVWVACSLAASAGFWVWRNQGFGSRR